MDLLLEVKICYARYPMELPDFQSVLNFFHNGNALFDQTNKIILLEDKVRDPYFQIRYQIDRIISKAVQKKSLQMYYQPIYDVKKKCFTHAEAFVRLVDEDYGIIMPDKFIHYAESSGSIHQIGDSVLDMVCRFISKDEYKSLGFERMAINLLPAQIIENDLCDKIDAVLAKYGLSPETVSFDITENKIVSSNQLRESNIQNISRKGISFSLDDYGDVFADFKSLIHLPIDIVKIDGSFVRGYKDERMKIVINSTINLLKKMDKKILMEGIENEDEAEYFISLGCDYLQGFYYGRPLPADLFLSVLKDGQNE